MEYKTFDSLKRIIERELDLEAEDFISETEMMGFFNQAVNYVEKTIINIADDYLLCRSDWEPLVSDMSLPSDIFANKLRKVEVRQSGSDDYRDLKRDRNLSKDGDPNYYIIFNTIGANPTFSPRSDELTEDEIRFYYIRNLNKYTDETSLCDVPEFYEYVLAFVRFKCHVKEKDVELVQLARQDVSAYAKQMRESLADMTDDGSVVIEPDISFYEDFDSQGLEG